MADGIICHQYWTHFTSSISARTVARHFEVLAVGVAQTKNPLTSSDSGFKEINGGSESASRSRSEE